MKNSKRDETQTQKVSVNRTSSNHLVNSNIEPFNRLGPAAPLFRVLLAGVKFPVKSIQDLHEKTRSENRLLKFADGCRLTKLYSIKDILDTIPKLEEQMPLKSPEEMIDWIVKTEKENAIKAKKPHLVCRIGDNHLKEFLKNRNYLISVRERYQRNQANPLLSININNYKSCEEGALSEPPEDLCGFLNKADESIKMMTVEAEGSITPDYITKGFIEVLDHEYNHLEDIVDTIIRNPQYSEEDVVSSIEQVRLAADNVKKRAEDALDLAQEAWCQAKYIFEHEEDYYNMYFPTDNNCSMPTNTTVFSKARDKHNEWKSENHVLWKAPKEIWDDADKKLSDAENKEAICKAAATIEPIRIFGWINLPTERGGRPEGIVHKIVIDIRNNTLANLDERLSNEQSYQVCYECQESGEPGLTYFFDIEGNYGLSSEGPSNLTITVKIVFAQHRGGSIAIFQTWDYGVFANSVGLNLNIHSFEILNNWYDV